MFGSRHPDPIWMLAHIRNVHRLECLSHRLEDPALLQQFASRLAGKVFIFIAEADNQIGLVFAHQQNRAGIKDQHALQLLQDQAQRNVQIQAAADRLGQLAQDFGLFVGGAFGFIQAGILNGNGSLVGKGGCQAGIRGGVGIWDMAVTGDIADNLILKD